MMVGTEFVESLVDSRTRGDHWDCGNHLGRRFAWNRPSKELSLTVHLMCSDLGAPVHAVLITGCETSMATEFDWEQNSKI